MTLNRLCRSYLSLRHQASGIPCPWEDYLQLVDWTGRIIRQDKRGSIDTNEPPILQRLSIQPDRWLHHATAFEHCHAKVFNQEEASAFIRAG